MVVFCAGTTGYNLTFDARYVWMRQKRIQGSHFAHLKQASQANRFVLEQRIDPCMAKLLAARVAWAAADNAVQVHGGNGFALEFPVSRILCDARILNIFEGAAEIQAQVIARRLLDGTN